MWEQNFILAHIFQTIYSVLRNRKDSSYHYDRLDLNFFRGWNMMIETMRKLS